MTHYPASSGSEEGGTNYAAINSNSINPAAITRLREARKKEDVFNTLSRETAKFHEERALKHGLTSRRGLAHFKAAKAYREAGNKLMEFFKEGPPQDPGAGPAGNVDPAALAEVHKEAMDFHKRCAKKHGLDTPQGQAHVQMLQMHQAAGTQHANDAKNQKAQQKQQKQQAKGEQQAGASGRKSPVPVPKKSEMPNQDIRQNKPPIAIKKAKPGMGESGKNVVSGKEAYAQKERRFLRRSQGN